MNKQQVKWTGDQRELPGHGVVSRGDNLTLPDHVATSYIYQGLAVKAKLNKPAKEDSK